MATAVKTPEAFYRSVLVDYLISMARTVEGSVNRAIEALLRSDGKLASEVFLREPSVNEMEIVIDEHAIRLLRQGGLGEEEIRFIVATLKINNDLERMSDLAVNIGQRAVSLAQMREAQPIDGPEDLAPMAAAVRAMVSKSLGGLIYRNVELAREVLESEDQVDRYKDHIFETLLGRMTANPSRVGADLQFLLAARHLERIADHATNIVEDILFWLRGLEIRHGRAMAAFNQTKPTL